MYIYFFLIYNILCLDVNSKCRQSLINMVDLYASGEMQDTGDEESTDDELFLTRV